MPCSLAHGVPLRIGIAGMEGGYLMVYILITVPNQIEPISMVAVRDKN
jgi:hypothetical protein